MRDLISSKDFREGFVEMLPACIGLIPFGLVCGVGAQAAGADWLAALGMATIIFSGAAQVLAIQLYAADAPTAVIILTCFVLGLRLLMYSAAMAPFLKPLPPSWQRGLAFLLTDQSFAAAIRRFNETHDARGGGLHFLGCGFALWLMWVVTNLVGFYAGNAIPTSWSLDFAVPLCLIALAALPMRLSLVVAGLIGIVVGTLAEIARERWTAR